MLNPLVLKLRKLAPLSVEDARALRFAMADARKYAAGQDVIRLGEKPSGIHVILEGFACRYTLLDDGSRQITAFLLPGDLCDLHTLLLNKMDENVGTLSECMIAEIPDETFSDLLSEHPLIMSALWRSILIDNAVLREWLSGIGRRRAEIRIAHLLCELVERLEAVGMASSGACHFPITQIDLADATGLSIVHVNRVLQKLRHDGKIRLSDRVLSIYDVERFREFCAFSGNYLQVENMASQEPGRNFQRWDH